MYYGAKYFEDLGYEKLFLSYPVLEEENFETFLEALLANAKKVMESIDFSEYEEVVLVAKSIGTVVACNPKNMKIIHKKDYHDNHFVGYIDEPYFRLLHTLNSIEPVLSDKFYVKTATLEDIPLFVDLINCSYSDLSVTYEEMFSYTKSSVYDDNLWIIVYDKDNSSAVGCGIAELDSDVKEGVLEWIQVLPEYRGKKIGQLIVNELLNRMVGKASFVTVSGKANNPTNPEMLYRNAGLLEMIYGIFCLLNKY